VVESGLMIRSLLKAQKLAIEQVDIVAEEALRVSDNFMRTLSESSSTQDGLSSNGDQDNVPWDSPAARPRGAVISVTPIRAYR